MDADNLEWTLSDGFRDDDRRTLDGLRGFLGEVRAVNRAADNRAAVAWLRHATGRTAPDPVVIEASEWGHRASEPLKMGTHRRMHAASAGKSRATSDKKTKSKRSSSTSSKRGSSSRTTREPSLPRLIEELEDHENVVPLDQDAIDAKCKELTVLPLADISEAYEQVPTEVDVIAAAEKAAEEVCDNVLMSQYFCLLFVLRKRVYISLVLLRVEHYYN